MIWDEPSEAVLPSEVGQLLRERGIGRSEAEEIGWTKLQIISRYLTRVGDDANDLEACFELARRNQARLLAHALSGKTVSQIHVVQFTMNDADRDELNNALLTFGAERSGKDLAKKNEALIEIVRAALEQKG